MKLGKFMVVFDEMRCCVTKDGSVDDSATNGNCL